jgi:hypothetical protein
MGHVRGWHCWALREDAALHYTAHNDMLHCTHSQQRSPAQQPTPATTTTTTHLSRLSGEPERRRGLRDLLRLLLRLPRALLASGGLARLLLPVLLSSCCGLLKPRPSWPLTDTGSTGAAMPWCRWQHRGRVSLGTSTAQVVSTADAGAPGCSSRSNATAQPWMCFLAGCSTANAAWHHTTAGCD